MTALTPAACVARGLAIADWCGDVFERESAEHPQTLADVLADDARTITRMRLRERGEPTWKTRGHNLEEFVEVVRRHGLWEDGVKHFAEAMQMQLPMEPTGAELTAAVAEKLVEIHKARRGDGKE